MFRSPNFAVPFRPEGAPVDPRFGSDWVSNNPRLREAEMNGHRAYTPEFGGDGGQMPDLFAKMVQMARGGNGFGMPQTQQAERVPMDRLMQDHAFVADFIRLIGKRGGDWQGVLAPLVTHRNIASEEFTDAPMMEAPHGQAYSQNMALVPRVWQSRPDHDPAMLAYITPAEADMLRRADIYGSGIDQRMHYGPSAVPSFQGDGPGGAGGSDNGGGGGGPDTGPGGQNDSPDGPGTQGGNTGAGGPGMGGDGGKGGNQGGTSDPHGMGGFGEGAIGGPNMGGAPGHQGGAAGSVGGPGGGAGSPSGGQADMDPFGMGQFGEIGSKGPNPGAAPGHQGVGGFQGVNSPFGAEGIVGADQGGFIGGEKRSIAMDNFASAVLDALGMRDPARVSHEAAAKGVLGFGLGTLVSSIPSFAEDKLGLSRDPARGKHDAGEGGNTGGGDNGGNPNPGGPPGPPELPPQARSRFTRPQERPAPNFLGLHPAMSNIQRRAAIATFATQGMDNRYRDQDTQDYWRNLIERALITDTGDLAEFGNVLPIELQYVSQFLGKGTPNSTQSLLEAIAAS